jgi:hypothetical protein
MNIVGSGIHSSAPLAGLWTLVQQCIGFNGQQSVQRGHVSDRYLRSVLRITVWSAKAEQMQRDLGLGTGRCVLYEACLLPDLLTTKRIIALEGDLVTPLPPSGPTPIRIPQGHCWVEGDSRFNTRDSNTYGPVRHQTRHGVERWADRGRCL